ncbi:MAG: DUF5677 domain-containing protein [Deltaproteobacteria bacterium]|nr:DUF5677 domain-containing protein [Deltaproteobacteria bacterium]
MALASLLIAGTYVTVAGINSLSTLQAIGMAALVVALVGLTTWAASRVRPWWPKTSMSRAIEGTRRNVEIEWSEPFRLAEKITAILDESVKTTALTSDMSDPKTRVIHGLSRQTIKNTKAALTMLQDGFPEAAICIWRTLFETRVNAGYIDKKNPRVAERFIDWATINYLDRTQPQDSGLQALREKWRNRNMKPDNRHGWTGNPPEDIVQRANAIGLQYGLSVDGLNQIDVYRLANSFVHADWTVSSNPMGQSDVDNLDGAAEGVGEVLYLIMETAFETISVAASAETRERLHGDLWKLRELVRGAPERLRGTFIRMPTTEIIGILPDGKILVSTVKRREEWPSEYEERTNRELAELLSMFESPPAEREQPPAGTHNRG